MEELFLKATVSYSQCRQRTADMQIVSVYLGKMTEWPNTQLRNCKPESSSKWRQLE